MAQYRNVKEFTDRIRKATPNIERNMFLSVMLLLRAKRNGTKNSAEVGELPKSNRKQRSSTMRKCESSRLAFESVEDRATAEFEAIKQECIDIFEPYNRATASMIDMPTLELLKSGILKDNELFDLADSFSDNVTMLRIIGKYAEERANIK